MTAVSGFPQNSIVIILRRSPLVTIYLIMFGPAGPMMITQALNSQGLDVIPIPSWLEVLSSQAPGLAAAIVAATTAARRVAAPPHRFLNWTVPLHWYLAGTFLMRVIILAGIGPHISFGGPVPVIP